MNTWNLIKSDFKRHSEARGISMMFQMVVLLILNCSFFATFFYRLSAVVCPPPFDRYSIS